MILVKGVDDAIWHAEVRHVLCAIKLVIFLHLRSKLWVRGSRSSQMDSINFSSILGIATGVWQHHV